MSTFFISDLHLGDTTPTVAQAFARFLETHARDAERLYILGDFFDAWVGDDDDSDFVGAIKAQLRDYTDRGTLTYLTRGNRDFLIGDQFARETGVQLLPELQVIDLQGEPTLIMHGDTLCTRDREYFAFRDMVQSPQWQQQVLALPLAERRRMARELRQKSQSMNAIKAQDIMDVTPQEVERVMLDNGVKRLIHGHTHRPARHALRLNEQDEAERWVLGDWHEKGWYIRADRAGLDLISFTL